MFLKIQDKLNIRKINEGTEKNPVNSSVIEPASSRLTTMKQEQLFYFFTLSKMREVNRQAEFIGLKTDNTASQTLKII